MSADLAAVVVTVVSVYVAAVAWSVGRHVHAVLDAVQERVAPEQTKGPVQLRPSRWGRANR